MQTIIQQIAWSIDQSLSILITNFAFHIPNIIAAFIVGVIGLFLAKLVYSSFVSFFKVIKMDDLFKYIGLQKFFDEVGLHFSISHFLAWLFKFIIDFITLLTVLALLGFDTVVRFISIGLISFVPTLLTVVILLAITFFVANKVKDLVLHSTLVTKNFSPITAKIAWLLIVIVGALTVLDYLKIATFLVNLTGAFVTFSFAGLALALGLAFGLGARQEAGCLVRGWMGKDCKDECSCNEYEISDYDEDLWDEMDDVEAEENGDIEDGVK